jgi:hypothetical protein
MKVNATATIGLLCAILAIAIFALIATQQSFPVFKSSMQTDRYVDITQSVGLEDSRFMWNFDNFALIGQALALFAAAAATLGLLRIDEEKKPQ